MFDDREATGRGRCLYARQNEAEIFPGPLIIL